MAPRMERLNPSWNLREISSAHGCMAIEKQSSNDAKKLNRIMIISSPYLLMVDAVSKGVKRVLLLHQIQEVQTDGGRVLIRATDQSKERDWAFRWKTDNKNTHTPGNALELINELRKPYVANKELQISDRILLQPRLTMQSGGRTPKETLEMIRSKRLEIPRRTPPPDDGSVLIQFAPEGYGMDVTERSVIGRPIRLKGVTPSGSAARAGVKPENQIITHVNNEPVMNAEGLLAILERSHDRREDIKVKFEAGVELQPTPTSEPADDPVSEIDPVEEPVIYQDFNDDDNDEEVVEPVSELYEEYEEPEEGYQSTEREPSLPSYRPRRSRKKSDFWRNFVASYDAQGEHWRNIENDVLSRIDTRIDRQVVPLDFEGEAMLQRDTRLSDKYSGTLPPPPEHRSRHGNFSAPQREDSYYFPHSRRSTYSTHPRSQHNHLPLTSLSEQYSINRTAGRGHTLI